MAIVTSDGTTIKNVVTGAGREITTVCTNNGTLLLLKPVYSCGINQSDTSSPGNKANWYTPNEGLITLTNNKKVFLCYIEIPSSIIVNKIYFKNANTITWYASRFDKTRDISVLGEDITGGSGLTNAGTGVTINTGGKTSQGTTISDGWLQLNFDTTIANAQFWFELQINDFTVYFYNN